MFKAIVDTVMSVVNKFIPDADKKLEVKEKISSALIDNEKNWRDSAVALQVHDSGVKWINGFKHLVRPVIALAIVIQWELYKFGVIDVWTKEDSIILGAVVGFYFISRGIEKAITKVL